MDETTEPEQERGLPLTITREHVALWLCGRMGTLLDSMSNMAAVLVDEESLGELLDYSYAELAKLSDGDHEPEEYRARLGAYWCAQALLLLALDSGVQIRSRSQTHDPAPSEAADGCGEMPQE